MGLDNEHVTAAMLTGKPWLAFDIETAPMPGCAEYLTDAIDAPSNYKDPLKIAAYIEEKRQKQIADAGLDLDLCEIVAVSALGRCGSRITMTRQEYTEAEILRCFWDIANGPTLVCFNGLSFDLPILLRRSLYLGVPAPNLQIDKYRHDGVIDVADVLTFSGRMTWRSLAFYCKRFGIPHDDSVKGEQIAQLVAEGRWDAIAAHVRADVASTAALAQRIGLIHQSQPADLDPDLFCLTHGKALPMGPYGIRYSGCEDCEPPEPDGEDFRGGEAAAYESEQQARLQRELK